MKKILTTLLFLAVMVCSALARGGHFGLFRRVVNDPDTGKMMAIEMFVAKPWETDPAKKKSWSRIVAKDDGNGKWDKLKVPIYVDEGHKPLVPQPKVPQKNDD
ncbi:MAG: hypothetical protein WC767_01660 [Candidatus Paceibacterota bacterium]|jgi:hypothetical protein